MSEEYSKANKNPVLVMIEMEWLVEDMSAELKARGDRCGGGHAVILKSHGERSIMALRESFAKFHGGMITPEGISAKERSQSNGAMEEAGKTIRDHAGAE